MPPLLSYRKLSCLCVVSHKVAPAELFVLSSTYCLSNNFYLSPHSVGFTHDKNKVSCSISGLKEKNTV